MTTATGTVYAVYIHPRGQRPRKVGETTEVKDTIELEGRTYYWVGADLSAKTLTYADMRPSRTA